ATHTSASKKSMSDAPTRRRANRNREHSERQVVLCGREPGRRARIQDGQCTGRKTRIGSERTKSVSCARMAAWRSREFTGGLFEGPAMPSPNVSPRGLAAVLILPFAI